MIIFMSRFAVISDIHGNFPALTAVLEEIDKAGILDIICLGDTVGYYCQINECIDLLRKRKIHCLLGNHDYYMISNTCCDSKTVEICIEYQKRIIRKDNFDWMKSLCPRLDIDLFSFRHGGWKDEIEERILDFDFSMVNDYSQKMFFSGHTHCQSIQYDEDGGRLYCNPGSVGQPRDNDPRAAYAIVNHDKKIELRRVVYDIDEIVAKMRAANQGEWIWKGLYTGEKVGGN